MPSNRERKLALRENQILQAATMLVHETGYTNLTMDSLADQAGIAKATLYQHFKNKDEVMVASTRRALTHLEQFMSEMNGPPVDQLKHIMRYIMKASLAVETGMALMMHDEMLYLFRQHNQISIQFKRLNEALFTLITQAKAEETIASDLPEAFVVSMIMTNTQVIKGQIVYKGSVDTDQFIDLTIQILFNGLRPTKS